MVDTSSLSGVMAASGFSSTRSSGSSGSNNNSGMSTSIGRSDSDSSGSSSSSRSGRPPSTRSTPTRVDTSTLSGIQALSNQPTTAERLQSNPTPFDRVSTHSDDEPPVGAIAGAAANDTARRTAPVSAETVQRRSIDAAAFDGLERSNGISIRDNLEYGGLIVEHPSGRYSATSPVRGDATGVNPYDATVPNNARVVGDYHTHGDYSVDNAGQVQRTTNTARDHYNSDQFSSTDFNGIRNDGINTPGYKGYLGTPSGEFRRFDPASGADTRFTIPAENAAGTARGGALTGAAVEFTRSTATALSDGYQHSDLAYIAGSTVQGGAAGGTQAVGEHVVERVIDQRVGPTVQRTVSARVASSGAGQVVDDVAVGTIARTAASRVGGAGVVGAAVGAGFSIYENREGLARGDSEAIGDVAGDTVVAAGSALAGAAAGAAVGSVVPVVGTAVGAVVGLGVGIGVDYLARRGGVDDVVGDAVSGAVDGVKSAGRSVARFFGFGG